MGAGDEAEVGPTGTGPVLLAEWLAGLSAVLAAVARLGDAPALSAPPVGRPGDLVAWASTREPVEAAFAVLRLAVGAGAGYLLAVALLALLARLVRAERLTATVGVVTVPLVRRLVGGAVGLGLVGATAAGTLAAGPVGAVASRPAAALVVPTWDGTSPPQVAEADGGPPTMERLDESPVPGGAPGSSEVTLVAGDHLWSTAERALASAWGRAPTDAEVVPYWRGLVAANRHRLPDPANPDLVLPGLTVVVPAPPPAP